MLLQLVLALELLLAEVALELPVVAVAEHVQAQFVLPGEDLLALPTLEDLLRVEGFDVLANGREVVEGLAALRAVVEPGGGVDVHGDVLPPLLNRLEELPAEGAVVLARLVGGETVREEEEIVKLEEKLN